MCVPHILSRVFVILLSCPCSVLCQVGIPEAVCKIMTIPEYVTWHNMELMKRVILNGPDVHPGAQLVQTPDGNKFKLTV